MKMTPALRVHLKIMIDDALDRHLFNDLSIPDGMEVTAQLVAHKLDQVGHQIRNELLMRSIRESGAR